MNEREFAVRPYVTLAWQLLALSLALTIALDFFVETKLVWLLPMCVLWLMAMSLAVAYYFAPCVADALEPVRQWQEANGVAAAFATQFVFCGMLPAVFLLTVKGIRTDRPLLKRFL